MLVTKMVFVGASVLIGCWDVTHGQVTPASLRGLDEFLSAAQVASLDANTLQRKLFVSVAQEPCTSSAGRPGTCRSSHQCAKIRGTQEGKCAFLGVGVCCVNAQSCNAKTSAQEATFVNPSYPAPEPTNVGVCSLAVTAKKDVCQLRVDLTKLLLAQPDNEGVCATDYLSVTGGSTVPRICGKNNGQHFYVDVSPGNTVNLNLNMRSVNQKWNIKVTQIPCNSPDRAPRDCLQYFTSTSDTITSFNYVSSRRFGTRQLADQSYAVCIGSATKTARSIRSYTRSCDSVTYLQKLRSDFSLTDDPRSLISPIHPHPSVPPIGTVNCTTDYIIIPSATILDPSKVYPDDIKSTDRFCGLAFPGATTSLKPFILYVVSDGGEAPAGDSNNKGFSLTYTLNGC